MANPTSAFGWQMPTSTDLVTDLPADFEVFGQAVDTSLADLKGGTTGQVLSKATNADMDFTWVTTDDANAIQNSIVDAKGDLIAASANDTPARLAVGNNGETLVADSSTATGLRWNTPIANIGNPVINGGLDCWQRGTSFSLAASTGNTYFADRWSTKTGANQAITVSRQATNDSTNLPTIQYAYRYQRNSGQTGTNGMEIFNSFETSMSLPFAGKTVTLSFWARAGANYSPTSNALLAYIISGTGIDQNRATGTYTGEAYPVIGTATLTTTWQRFAFTGTIAATATELCAYFNYQPTGTAGANDYFEVTGVQIDIGTFTSSTAPAFRRSGGTIQGELAACQRYYWRGVPTGAYTSFSTYAPATSTTTVYCPIPMPVNLRGGAPTLDYSNIGVVDNVNAVLSGGTWTIDASSSGVGQVTVKYVHTAASLTQYRPYIVCANGTTSAYLGLSAEL